MSLLDRIKLPEWGWNEDGKPDGFLTGLAIGVIIFFLFAFISNPDAFQWHRELDSVDGKPVERFDSSPQLPRAEERCRVDRIVDGDTIIVISDGERVRVRMIGVNTPETVKRGTTPEPYGKEASNYTANRIAAFGNIVTLRSDGDPVDKFGRRLALVYLGRDGTELLNEELIRHGLGKAEPQYRYSDLMKDKFRNAESEAKAEKIGIWSLPENTSNNTKDKR